MKFIFILISFICFNLSFSQQKKVTVSGIINDKISNTSLPFVNVILKAEKDNAFVSGTVTNDKGRFVLSAIPPGNYILETSFVGYSSLAKPLYVGSASEFIDLGILTISQDVQVLNEVVIKANADNITNKMDKKVFSVADNVSQSGGSVLQSMRNLPGVTVQDGKVQLRGNDKITVLIDGKQTALTGFGNQSGLDNIPASAIDKIEIINNPSSKYDANGNAGIINIIYKKNKKEGFNGKVSFNSGLGALWKKKENLPTIRPQYQLTPKINPSLTLNYKKEKLNFFLQADNLYTQTLNKNEFVTRLYDDGTIINQQLKRNRNTNFFTSKTGLDWEINDKNSLTISTLFGTEKIIDRGDQPFFNADYSERNRLWKFLEDELKTTFMATAIYQHKLEEPGHLINFGFNYTFHREDEKYFFDNILRTFTGRDSFKLLSDEKVADFTIDYVKPLQYGKLETGVKLRARIIPTNMQFFQGINSPIDANAGGEATYKELIPAIYGNYIFETEKWETEIGLRVEYMDLNYEVNPDHNTYKSDGYTYFQPFPTMRLAYKINENNKISLFYNRRIDRPNEVDIRIFPKYDDAEIIKVGNPGLRPQFTNAVEIGFKTSWEKGSFYTAFYHRFANATITRISTSEPNSTLIYAVFQNAGKSYTTGTELILSQELTSWYSFNINANGYFNQINAFSVTNLYPTPTLFSADKQDVFSGNLKFNNTFKLSRTVDALATAIYLAPDIIPQGKIDQRFSFDIGLKKSVQKGKGEFFMNATDLFNTMVIKKEITSQGFSYTSSDYYETQVIRVGYSYKF